MTSMSYVFGIAGVVSDVIVGSFLLLLLLLLIPEALLQGDDLVDGDLQPSPKVTEHAHKSSSYDKWPCV